MHPAGFFIVIIIIIIVIYKHLMQQLTLFNLTNMDSVVCVSELYLEYFSYEMETDSVFLDAVPVRAFLSWKALPPTIASSTYCLLHFIIFTYHLSIF